MSTADEIDNLVNRFLDDLLDMLARARSERRAAMLATVQSMLTEQGSKPAAPQPPRPPPPSRTKKAPPRAKEAPRTLDRRGPATRARDARNAHAPAPPQGERPPPPRARRHIHPVPIAEQMPLPLEPARAPETVLSSEHDSSARERLVLEAVRTLVRATAGEIAQHTGLPNGTVYVVLRALLTAKRVAKNDAASGAEYSLVSNGSVRPFKRAKAGEAPNAPDAGGSPTAAPLATRNGEHHGAAEAMVGREPNAEGREFALGPAATIA